MADPTIEKMLSDNPLLLFSEYSQVQLQSLRLVREELRDLKPVEASNGTWNGGNFERYYSFFWLWVLGAYECLRTMDQHRVCFSQRVQMKVTELKKKVAILRMPFAKQELQGEITTGPKAKPTKFHGESSVIGVRNGYVFEVAGQEIESEVLMDDVLGFLTSIDRKDILQEMPVTRPGDFGNP